MENVILFVDGALLAHVSITSITLMMWFFDIFDTYKYPDRNSFINLLLMLALALLTVIFIFIIPTAIYLFFGLAASLDISQFDGKALTYVRNQGLQELPTPKIPFLIGFLITFPLAGRWIPLLATAFDHRKMLASATDEISDRAIKEFFLSDIQKFNNLGPIKLAIDP